MSRWQVGIEVQSDEAFAEGKAYNDLVSASQSSRHRVHQGPCEIDRTCVQEENAYSIGQYENEQLASTGRRAPRPGQLVPHHRRQPMALDDLYSSDDEDTGDLVEQQLGAAAGATGSSGSPISHAERKARLGAKWTATRPIHTEEVRTYERFRRDDTEATTAFWGTHVRCRIQRSLDEHACCMVPGHKPLHLESVRPVVCYFLGGTVTIDVPRVSCPNCQERWEVRPGRGGGRISFNVLFYIYVISSSLPCYTGQCFRMWL